jgi:tight adherence protein B
MLIISYIAAAIFACGCFVILRINPKDIILEVRQISKKSQQRLTSKVSKAHKKGRQSAILRVIKEARIALILQGDEDKFATTIYIGTALAVGGVLIAVALGNVLLIPILALIAFIVPFVVVLASLGSFYRNLTNELEGALSLITNTYMRQSSLAVAVQRNLPHISGATGQVFEKYVDSVLGLGRSSKDVLMEMREDLPSAVYTEWIDACVLCEDNSDLKTTLLPIARKLSDAKAATMELDLNLYEPLKEFGIMAVFCVGAVPFIYFMRPEWGAMFVQSWLGRIIMAATYVLVLIGIIAAARANRPADFESRKGKGK